jgi:hypothetical protein
MSDTPPVRRPLFPDPPQPQGPPPPEPAGKVDVELASKIERTVVDVFVRRFGGQSMPYNQARVLAYLEAEVVRELVNGLATAR